MNSMFLKQWRYVLAVTLHGAHLTQILPLPLKQVLASSLAIKHLIAKTGVELLRVRLCKEISSFVSDKS